MEYFNYLHDYKENFINTSNIDFTDDLKEFLRGANRYSDEFVFSEYNYTTIRRVINELYDMLTQASSPL